MAKSNLLSLIFITFPFFAMIDTISLKIKTPNNDFITLEVVDFNERQRLLENEVDSLFKIQEEFFYSPKIFRLKNSYLLLLYTVDAHALKFEDEHELNKFLNNDDHFTVSLHFDKKGEKFHYKFWLHNDKSLELVKKIDKEIDGYKVKCSTFDYKLYRLKDGTYFRAEKVNEKKWEASWFATLEDFQYYYNNDYVN